MPKIFGNLDKEKALNQKKAGVVFLKITKNSKYFGLGLKFTLGYGRIYKVPRTPPHGDIQMRKERTV